MRQTQAVSGVLLGLALISSALSSQHRATKQRIGQLSSVATAPCIVQVVPVGFESKQDSEPCLGRPKYKTDQKPGSIGLRVKVSCPHHPIHRLGLQDGDIILGIQSPGDLSKIYKSLRSNTDFGLMVERGHTRVLLQLVFNQDKKNILSQHPREGLTTLLNSPEERFCRHIKPVPVPVSEPQTPTSRDA